MILFVGIEITEGPRNITAYVGDSVTLPCKYTGTLAQPKWRIGQASYASSNLPAGYEYTNEGLHIPSVWVLLNNTVFVCFFTVHVGGGRVTNIESQPASITVRSKSIVMFSSCTLPFTFKMLICPQLKEYHPPQCLV